MELYVLRHGVAEERGEAWPDDRRRPLTAEGKAKTREVATGLHALGVAPDAIFSSPLVRARQTAEIVALELGLVKALRETRHLEPGAAPAALFAAIREAAPNADAVMLVGHEPDLGVLVARLLGGEGGALDCPLKKAGLARLEVDAMPPKRRATLRWFVPPAVLRAIGRR
jgi:phosphohistidine phosphatase